MKIKNIIKCECGKEIIGFSKQHVKQNMILHKLSKEHKQRINLMKLFVYEIIDVRELNDKGLNFLMENHPNIINDIVEIGKLK